jgi:thiosulfate/3-mercaptopyruvate sulfurtransferase
MRLLAFFVFLITIVPVGHSQSRIGSLFVSTEWLAGHGDDPGVIVLHVGFNRPEYRLGHIPGARFLWYDWLVVSTPDASTELPSLTQADSILEMLGVSNTSTIVLCFSGTSLTAATRMFLTLDYFGLGQQTVILDGGLERWKVEKRPVSTGEPLVQRSILTLRQQHSVIVDAGWLKENLTNPTVAIIDARDRRFFDGNGGGTVRTGHITGARSLPFSSLVDSTNRVRDRQTIVKLFEEAGVVPQKTAVVYCHVGQQATLVYALAKELGFSAALYDGSFQDWNLRGEEYPVEKPATPAK